MSEQTPSVDSNLEQLKKVHACYVFVHQVLTQSTSYRIDEFEIAKDAIRLITDTANKLSDNIQAQLPKEVTDSNEQV